MNLMALEPLAAFTTATYTPLAIPEISITLPSAEATVAPESATTEIEAEVVPATVMALSITETSIASPSAATFSMPESSMSLKWLYWKSS